MKEKADLPESEIRSIVRSELALLSERAGVSLELTVLVEDAMLDGLRSMVASGGRNSFVMKAVKNVEGADPRATAEATVARVLQDPDFRTDMVGLIAALIKRNL